jgi:hypothetical protein
VLARLDSPVSRAEYDSILSLNGYRNEGAYFRDVDPTVLQTWIGVAYASPRYDALTRLAIVGAMLLLTAGVVGVGMALWAAEGKDERDILVSIGASPRVLARVAAIKAGLLAFVGGVIAVPLGFGTLRLAIGAAGEETRFPWLVVAGVVVVVPASIAVGALAGSAAVQRARPVRMSSLATD